MINSTKYASSSFCPYLFSTVLNQCNGPAFFTFFSLVLTFTLPFSRNLSATLLHQTFPFFPHPAPFPILSPSLSFYLTFLLSHHSMGNSFINLTPRETPLPGNFKFRSSTPCFKPNSLSRPCYNVHCVRSHQNVKD